MKAIILAAGMGKRMGRLTEKIPKALLIYKNKTILYNCIINCYRAGIKKFIIVAGFNHSQVKKECEKIAHEVGIAIELVINKEYACTNTGQSLLLALINQEDDVLVINGDNIFDPLIIPGILNKKNSTLVIDNKKVLTEESFKISIDQKTGVITRMGKRIDPEKAEGEFIGISKIVASDLDSFCIILKNLVNINRNEYYDNAFVNLSTITPIDFYYLDGLKWTEVDTVEDFEYALTLNFDIE